MYVREGKGIKLKLVVQVDHHLYAGPSGLPSELEQYLQTQFQTCSTEKRFFNIKSAHLFQNKTIRVTIDASEKPDQIELLVEGSSKEQDRAGA